MTLLPIVTPVFALQQARIRKFSPENLEGLVKFAYFGGFIDMAGVRRLLMVDKPTARQLLVKWYEEVREQGCWLC